MPVVVLSNDSKDELVRRGLQLAGENGSSSHQGAPCWASAKLEEADRSL
jgi:hypothetical protein